MVKIVDVRETQKKTKNANKDRKEQEGTKAIIKGCELNDFAVNLS